jgi:mRNA-degrading endonuclease toxin of MazEF toxin-antitoxin module
VARLTAVRGEIWLADLGTIQKTRPVLVLSVAYKDEERAVVTFVGRTTSLRGTEYEVAHSAPRFSPGAFDAQGLNTMAEVQLIRRLCVCDAATLAKVEAAVLKWLGLSNLSPGP